MIVLFRPPLIKLQDFAAYSHALTVFAGKVGESVVVRDDTQHNVRTEWTRVSLTPGRVVVWVRPTFIPLPAFWSELDAYLDAGLYVVALRAYDLTFPLGSHRPCAVESRGISRAMTAFQLSTSPRPLPELQGRDPYDALDQGWGGTARVEQRYAGTVDGPCMRSTFGTEYPDVFGGNGAGIAGRRITGDLAYFSTPALLDHWRREVEAWERYLKVRP